MDQRGNTRGEGPRDLTSKAELGTGPSALNPEISATHHCPPLAHPAPHAFTAEPGLTAASQQPDPAVPGPYPAWTSGPHSLSEAAHRASARQREGDGGKVREGVHPKCRMMLEDGGGAITTPHPNTISPLHGLTQFLLGQQESSQSPTQAPLCISALRSQP